MFYASCCRKQRVNNASLGKRMCFVCKKRYLIDGYTYLAVGGDYKISFKLHVIARYEAIST